MLLGYSPCGKKLIEGVGAAASVCYPRRMTSCWYTTDAPARWRYDVQRRIHELRGETSRAALSEASGLPERVILALEAGSYRNLYLDQVWPLVRALDTTPDWLLSGARVGEALSSLPSTDPRHLPLHVVDLRTRQNIRALRGPIGTPTVALQAWGSRNRQSTLVRWESGDYRRLDLPRLQALAIYLSRAARPVTIIDLLVGQLG